MQVKDIMTGRGKLKAIPPTATIQDAARAMRQNDVGFLPIGEGDDVLGLVTDRDLACRALADGMAPDTPVRDVMTPDVWKVAEDDDVGKAATMMREQKVRRLVVTDASGSPSGVLSLGDIAVHADDLKAAGALLESISEPAQPAR